MKRCTHCGREADEAAASCTTCGRGEFVDETAPTAGSKGRAWVGVVLSLVVPGFGIARGNRLGLAVVWFLALELGLGLVAVSFALERIPFWTGMAAGACWLAAAVVMLYQSYRPGRMTGPLWAAFAGVLALTVVLPSPAELVARPFKMPTRSMSPTLQGASGHDDHLVVDRLTYRFSLPRRGDLLVFLTDGIPELPPHQVWVKRLVGMPGERLEIHDGSVFANGVRLSERDGIPPIRFVTRDAIERGDAASRASYQLDKQSYFVLGDNATNSLDSRYFGCIPRENVYGKVTAIYYPFSRAGRPRYTGEPNRAAKPSQPTGSQTNQLSTAAGPGR